MNRTQAYRLSLAAVAFLGAQGLAHAWSTPEHVQFGNGIAVPFENELLKHPLPVLRAVNTGPSTFGHWVSAPDFGRSLVRFYKQQRADSIIEDWVAGIGSKVNNIQDVPACSVSWTADGLRIKAQDGSLVDVDDQGFSKLGLSGDENLADCINGWRLNNSHFGDFARAHFMYYHMKAVEAAHLARTTGQDLCRAAAYTLEGWSQHYLTDSTASGHGWNPAGGYDTEKGHVQFVGDITHFVDVTPQILQSEDGTTHRMEIHDFLNTNGAKMAGAFFGKGDQGVFWGDNSQKHSSDGKRISDPDHVSGDPQTAVTLRLGRMALGQVIAAAECGGNSDPTAVLRERSGDPRRPYVSNYSMCKAMTRSTGHPEIHTSAYVPDLVNDDVLNLPDVISAVNDCSDNMGELKNVQDGNDLAMHYFRDANTRGDTDASSLPYSDDPAGLENVVDQQAKINLEDLGCLHNAPPGSFAGQMDLCGNTMCENATGYDGRCGVGFQKSAGCCYPSPRLGGGSDQATVESSWSVAADSLDTNLRTAGAVPGDETEMLWVTSQVAATAPTGDTVALGEDPVTAPIQSFGSSIPDAMCGAHGYANIFETRIKLPSTSTYADKAVFLTVRAMDEGLKVQVNGHLVGSYTQSMLARGPLSIPLFTPAMHADGDTYVVRLTSLNSCGAEVAPDVSLSLASRTKSDDPGYSEDPKGSGCSMGPDAATPRGAALLGLILFALFGVRRARRRMLERSLQVR
jgi:MYXO-CTERM domain-containing protein